MTREELQSKLVLSGAYLDDELEETVEEMRTRLINDAIYCSGLQANAQTVKMPKNYVEIKIKSLGLIPTEFTPKGAAQVSAAVLKKLAGRNLFDDEKTWSGARRRPR